MPSENTGKRTCRDHLNQEYPTKAAMARAWGISENLLYTRLRSCMDLETALTCKDPLQAHKMRSCTDHKGNEYPSITAMCAHYGLKPYAYTHRIRRGWSVERALTTPEDKNPVIDHEGNEHESVSAMCRFWDIPLQVYYTRKRQGLPLDQVLDPERKMGPRPCSDGRGRDFPTVRAMRKYWFSTAVDSGSRIDLDVLYRPATAAMKTLPAYGIEVARKLGSCRMIKYKNREYVMTVQGLHALLCRAALEELSIPVGDQDPEDAWHAYVCERYAGRRQAGDTKEQEAAS